MENQEVVQEDAVLDVDTVYYHYADVAASLPEGAVVVSLVIVWQEVAYECKRNMNGTLTILCSHRKTYNDEK